MDLNGAKSQAESDSTTWTNERHFRFLNSMEATFVRSMFESHGRLLPLDRHLPDTSDSTLDSKFHRPKKSINSGYFGLRGRMDGRANKRSRRITSSQPSNSRQDQVVPQWDNRTGGDKDERDHPNVPFAPVS